MVLGGQDEIQQYLDARYIGPPEAAWRIFGYSLHEEKPIVVRLQLHLPGMYNVVFNANEEPDVVRSRAQSQRSTLMAFFKYCAANQHARLFTYQEFRKHFVWKKKRKLWTKRKRGTAIDRMYFASPNARERFYLRLLLITVKGPTSFRNLRTFEGVVHHTFKSACVARGLLEDDEEWLQCLQEAAIMNTGYQLRRLFSIILLQWAPLQPDALWNRFSMNLCDDLAYKIRKTFNIPAPSDIQIADYGLYLLNQLVQESGKCLTDFPPMPQPIADWTEIHGNRFLWEHRQLQYDAQEATIDVDCLNDEQLTAFTVVTNSVNENKGTVNENNGGVGTGKTFLYNTIASTCRSQGHIVVTVA